MALRFNNTEITRVYFNGIEKMALKFNGTGYFGKRFSLTKSTSTGVTITVKRTSSPNQRASTGTVSTGNTIYYGDAITITCTASSGYTNPKLYVNTGSGNVLRTSPYSFTVTGNVTFYGTATKTDTWTTLWSGSKTFTGSAPFTVSGINANKEIQISATAKFEEKYIYNGETLFTNPVVTRGVTRATLPRSLYGTSAYVRFTVNGNQIVVSFFPTLQETKGYYIQDTPISVTLTEVRMKG